MTPDVLRSLDELRSRAEIAEVVMRYCRGFDRCDREMLLSCFHPGATHEHGAFTGLSSNFCDRGLETVRAVVLTHHQLGQISIELDGERAYAESYFTSYHRFGPQPPPGGEPHEDRIMGGRYIDRFERRDGVWRIAHRQGVNEWLRYEAPSDRGFFARPASERGRRDRDDPVYRRD
ncbi:MAG TPA: nuclear transport factor 2 family protein [Caulobacteraceae bacterium]